MKGHWWLIPGFVCLVTGVYFLGQGEKPSQFESGSVSPGPSCTGPYSPTKEDRAEAGHGVPDDRPHSANASAPADAPVTGHRAIKRTQFLDPDVQYTGITQTDVNRTVVNVGRPIDATDASPGVSGSQQTPIIVGEYLDPDPMSQGLESVYMSGASENTPSDIGAYLDPNAGTVEASSVEPSGQGDVGSRMDVDR
jgi:hypothetical protein